MGRAKAPQWWEIRRRVVLRMAVLMSSNRYRGLVAKESFQIVFYPVWVTGCETHLFLALVHSSRVRLEFSTTLLYLILGNVTQLRSQTQARQSWLPHASGMTLGKLLNFSVPLFSHLWLKIIIVLRIKLMYINHILQTVPGSWCSMLTIMLYPHKWILFFLLLK